ncbi:MAG: TetR/AcrR family transcriptional regulator [Oscillospiraceae bacterium]|nr:TetR/AcrR family transcriptional regulator [Oscillospiraceae bacterium]
MKGDKGEKRKQELLKIAYRLIISKGYEETSIDEIIAEAQIAKGTFYYHFKSKEEMLEALINMMITEQTQRAKQVLSAPLPIPQKTVAVITSLRPNSDEATIQDALNRKDNIAMHEKINRRIIDEAVPILSEVVAEGIAQGILDCDNINERVRMILIISSDMFNHASFTSADIDVFIDTVEKILGAKKDTFGFIRQLIQ